MAAVLCGASVVAGVGSGDILSSDVGLSFWGGVNPKDGVVIDRSHPWCGQTITGKVLVLPSGRGSCTGSQVVLELLLAGTAPAAILLSHSDEIIPLGVIVGEELFGRSMPVVRLGSADFERASSCTHAQVRSDGTVWLGAAVGTHADAPGSAELMARDADLADEMRLSADDVATLDGRSGAAARAAMRILLRTARLQGVRELLDVRQVHIDGCIYVGPASLRFARQLVEWGGRFRVPTTLNAISVDQRRWRALGVPTALGEPASALGDAYVSLGASPSFTCAPYLLNSAPALGEHIGWGESNAVVFANSCLGARTQKYADFLDACIALTGRAPAAGSHLDHGRRATLLLRADADVASCARGVGRDADAFWPTLGYLCGLEAAAAVPVLDGLAHAAPTRDDLKAFSAAFGTSASAPLFHLAGHTPEAPTAQAALSLGLGTRAAAQAHAETVEVRTITLKHLERTYATLNGERMRAGPLVSAGAGSAGADDAALPAHTAADVEMNDEDQRVQLVALGNPHFSADECGRLASMIAASPEPRHGDVSLVLTLGRTSLEEARRRGHAQALEAFGVTLLTDTCWCMLTEPVVPMRARTLITNSAKYAHYGPGLVGRRVRFASLAGCLQAARSGRLPAGRPTWLTRHGTSTGHRSFGTLSRALATTWRFIL